MSKITKPTETIHLPAPSWGPAVFAFGVLGLIAGTFANDFMFPAWCYAFVGFFLVLFSLRSMIRKGRRAYFAMPREQGDARAELPVESFRAPSAD
ncbi:MAG: hypothetical protein KDB48_02855 [Solirubrobacterales bacterium]|nr:hypothetical protein [Solirubrobacterales bacterium]HMT04164.1 hypothetical protein [Solirubrobacterales bacterium]